MPKNEDDIGVGDWVTVVGCCSLERECKADLGLVFKVADVRFGMVAACDGALLPGGMAQHPVIAEVNPVAGWIPFAWLRKHPPESECKTESLNDEIVKRAYEKVTS